MDKLYISTNFLSSNHNYSISYIYNNEIFCIELERLNRIKDYPSLPWKDTFLDLEIFDSLDKETSDIKVKKLWIYLSKLLYYSIIKNWVDLSCIKEIYFINLPINIEIFWYKWKIFNYKHNYHHLFHAFSAFYWSWFNSSVVLCMDHDWYDEFLWSKDIMHSIWLFDKDKFECLSFQEFSPIKWYAWIWAIYEISSKICWLWEWTFMWLSSFWIDRWPDLKIFNLTSDWVFIDNTILWKNNFIDYYDIHKNIKNGLIKRFWIKETNKFIWIENSIYADFAFKVQSETENAIFHLAKLWFELTWISNISIAWWIWLNIPSNSKIISELPYKNIFVQPACHDSGLSLWGLYYLYHVILWNKNIIDFKSWWLWFSYSDQEILLELNKRPELNYELIWDKKYKIAAELLSNWSIIWWFQWKTEFWPRALWFRSIFSWAFSLDIKNRLNDIKWRERYRPLAPILLEEDIDNYFLKWRVSPFMTMSFEVKKNKINNIIWAVHVDWTARYQSVNQDNNFFVYNLLKEYKSITWESLIINTSFNQNNEPIVEKPLDAIKMFLSTDLDKLFIWNYIVGKKKVDLKYKYNSEKYIFNHNNIIW